MSEQSILPTTSAANIVSADDGPRYRAAFQRLLPTLRSMKPHEYATQVNADIPTVVTSTMGNVLERIFSFRPEIAKLPDFDIAQFDLLPDILMAMAHAQVLYTAAYSAGPELQQLYEDAAEKLSILTSDVQAAVRRNLMNGDKLKELRGANGYRNVAFDLMTVIQMMLANWERIAGKTATTREELKQAETLAEKLSEALGEREKAPAAIAAASEDRQRVFNLFLKSYGQARRAITYLRWDHGDSDVIVPSIYVGRAGRRKPGTEDPEPTPPAVPPASPPAIGSTPSAGASLPSGLPGGDPLEDA